MKLVFVALFAAVAALIATFSMVNYAKKVSEAIDAGDEREVVKLFNLGLKRQSVVLFTAISCDISKSLDHLARIGVTRSGVLPWSQVVGGDGNRYRYERELNVFGFYIPAY